MESGSLKTKTAAKKADNSKATARCPAVCGMAARISHRAHISAASQKNAPFPRP